MLHFKKLRWKNLLSYGNEFTELNLSEPGTTLIVGTNGVGKSVFIEAMCYGLFGKSFRNINKPQLINSITNRELLVELELVVGQNQYLIRRGMKPNVFEVYCNDVLVNQSAEMRDYQEHLEKKILRTNYKTFCQVVILGTASFVPFMQLPAAQRRAIIEDLLDLQIFGTMNTLLKVQVQENQERISNNQTDQRILIEKIKLLKEHLQSLKSKSEQFISEKKQTIVDLKSKIASIVEEQKALQEQADYMSADSSNVDKIKTKLDKIMSIRSQIEAKSSVIGRELKFFEKNTVCPTCKQEIDSHFSCEAINSRSKELDELATGISELETKYKEEQDKLQYLLQLEKQHRSIVSSISHLSIKINMYNDQIVTIRREIELAKTSESTEELGNVAQLESELHKLISEYNTLHDDKQVLTTASALLKDGGIKTKIINQYIPVINKLINKYLSDFDLFVEFHLDEQFNEVIKSRHRDVFSYGSFSEGEKQRINLAILFAWRAVAKLRNSLNTNLLILDEILDSGVDSDGLENLHKVISGMHDTSVFVISHREAMQDKFACTLKVVKHKNFSRIEGFMS